MWESVSTEICLTTGQMDDLIMMLTDLMSTLNRAGA